MHEALGLEHLAGQGLVSLEDLWRKHTAKTRIARFFELPGRTRMLGGVRGVPGNRAPISMPGYSALSSRYGIRFAQLPQSFADAIGNTLCRDQLNGAAVKHDRHYVTSGSDALNGTEFDALNLVERDVA